MALRKQVVDVYRRIFRLAKTWTSMNPQDSWAEQEYIKEEARTLFKKNKFVTIEDEIREHVKEAETRLEVAIHYQNPYPRPVYAPPNVILPEKKRGHLRGTQRRLKQSKPIYVKSYESDDRGRDS